MIFNHMNKLPLLIIVAFLLVLYFTGCTEQQLAASDRVIDAYRAYRQPAATGYAK